MALQIRMNNCIFHSIRNVWENCFRTWMEVDLRQRENSADDCPGVTLNESVLEELMLLLWVNEAAPREAPSVSVTFPVTFSSRIN